MTATIQVDFALEQEARAVFSRMGMTVSDAVNDFLRRAIREEKQDGNISADTTDVQIPKELLALLQSDRKSGSAERNALLLYPYIQNLTISHGRAAEILHISKWKLIELYDKLGFPYLDQDPEEVEKELEAFYRAKGESA